MTGETSVAFSFNSMVGLMALCYFSLTFEVIGIFTALFRFPPMDFDDPFPDIRRLVMMPS